VLAVVIPAKNEAARIQTVIRQVLHLPVSLVVPVLNGCTDATPDVVRRLADHRIKSLQFTEPLGYDIPRIAGAQAALTAGAHAILFVDADLGGLIEPSIAALVQRASKDGLDLALSDCYVGTPVPYRDSAARRVYRARLRLNEALSRPDLGVAIPSHGPSLVSRRLLETVPLGSLGIPPLMQALACRAGLKVEIAGFLPHRDLGSAQRDHTHRLTIAETIIGDCLHATCVATERPVHRAGHLGYHPTRRFDLVGMSLYAGGTDVRIEVENEVDLEGLGGAL
jgi:glycosyltransferase involved in cell wall biosynthesis